MRSLPLDQEARPREEYSRSETENGVLDVYDLLILKVGCEHVPKSVKRLDI